MRVQVVDPSAYTPPYDHSLCGALARAGAEVELVTSRFLYGPVPDAAGYRTTELFYRRGPRRAGSRARFAAKLLQHPADMRRLRAGRGLAIPTPDVRHFQWLSVPPYDARAISRFAEPTVLTAHDVLPREPRPGQARAQRRLYDAVNAVVVHSEHGRERLIAALGTDADKVRVIPHGAFDYLARQRGVPLDPELEAWLGEGPVALFFGLLRPYKGVDALLRAWRRVSVPEARLVVAGMPRMPLGPLRELADTRVRFVPRFVADPEIPAFFRRAQVVVLPYLEIDQSGVLYTALAFGKACLLSRVGGFTEVGERDGAARLFEPGDEDELAAALTQLLFDADARERLEAAARRAAEGTYSWDSVAERTLALYGELRR